MKLRWTKVKDRKQCYALVDGIRLYEIGFLEGARKWQAMFLPRNWTNTQFLFRTDKKGILIHDTKREAKRMCQLHYDRFGIEAKSWQQLERKDAE